MNVRVTQLDGKLPNLALMKLAQHHRAAGDAVHFSRSPYRAMYEPGYDRVYGSAIFSFSATRVHSLRDEFPGAIVGGTWNTLDPVTVEETIGESEDRYDYSLYPCFDGSIGFTARGCRLKCGFCVVPKKEGKPRSVNTIAQLWRGPPHPKHLHLLDNDFFGQPRDQWEARIAEIREGKFKVCWNQGINIRMIDATVATALASVEYRDDQFNRKRLYTAWDSLGDEKRFFRGVDTLADHGVPPRHLLVYMLVGYDPRETWQSILYRFDRMAARGIRPYPMIYGDRSGHPPPGDRQHLERHTLYDFQRWAVRKIYTHTPFEAYDNTKFAGWRKTESYQEPLFEMA